MKYRSTRKKTKTIRWYPLPVPQPTSSYKSTIPTYPIPSIICINNTMDMTFLLQLGQSNKCGNARNDEIINLHLGSNAGPCLLQDTSHIYWFHPPTKSTGKKAKNPEMRSIAQHIASYCFDLHTQNSGFREADLEASPRSGSEKINMLKQGRNTQKKASHIVQPRLGI